MARRRGRPDLGVLWFLPGKKLPVATTTVASSDLIRTLAADGLTWSQMVAEICYDPEARQVAELFVEAGHGDEVPVCG